MSTTESCIFAAVVVLVVLIVAVFVVYRRVPNRASRPVLGGAATTLKLWEAVALLGSNLTCISRVADSVNGRGQKIENGYGLVDTGPAYNEARLSLTGARQGMAKIVESIKRLNSTLNRVAPAYQNVLGLYQGLRDSDQPLREAAKNLDLAGLRMQGLVALPDGRVGTEAPHALKQELGFAATQLRQISACFYGLVRSVHHLGNALQLE